MHCMHVQLKIKWQLLIAEGENLFYVKSWLISGESFFLFILESPRVGFLRMWLLLVSEDIHIFEYLRILCFKDVLGGYERFFAIRGDATRPQHVM